MTIQNALKLYNVSLCARYTYTIARICRSFRQVHSTIIVEIILRYNGYKLGGSSRWLLAPS